MEEKRAIVIGDYDSDMKEKVKGLFGVEIEFRDGFPEVSNSEEELEKLRNMLKSAAQERASYKPPPCSTYKKPGPSKAVRKARKEQRKARKINRKHRK